MDAFRDLLEITNQLDAALIGAWHGVREDLDVSTSTLRKKVKMTNMHKVTEGNNGEREGLT